MKSALLLSLLFIFSSGNELSDTARAAFENKEYKRAAGLFKSCAEKWPELKEQALYNEATSWMLADSADKAQNLYGLMGKYSSSEIRSRAGNNRAVILSQQQKIQEALELLKQSLRDYPENELARYNYELLKKRIQNPPPPPEPEPEQEHQKQQQNTPSPKKPKPTEQNGNQSEAPQISKDQAERVLEGMKQNEQKFIQQLRKSVKSKPERDGTPDW